MQCPDCGEELVAVSLEVHQQTQNGVDMGGRYQWDKPPQIDRIRHIGCHYQLRREHRNSQSRSVGGGRRQGQC